MQDNSARTQRLPVNPRRRKVAPENRKRVAKALECAETPSAASLYSEPSGIDDADAAEGRMLFDPDGNVRYLGETSGATFLDLLKAFMLTLVPLAFVPEPGATVPEDGSTFVASLGRYQTFDSRPLLDLDVDPFWLPTRTEMIMMLAELRYHIQDGNGDFPSGGMFYWGDLSSLPEAITLTISQSEAATSDRYRYLAFNHVSFALAAQVLNQSLHQGGNTRRRRLFQKSPDTFG
ncbi:hypothetical protein N0V90_006170 [Kalmusia sp. IMI 367209]|nr:hypothetical protein N0V90_006170 [Kalmusia sp. IMI 367209]